MNIKKKLALMSGTGLLGLGLVVSGTTFALFTSSTTNSNNIADAGTIIIEQDRDSGDTVPGPMFYSNAKNTSNPPGDYPYDKDTGKDLGGEIPGGWAPGDIVTRAMNIFNRGTLDAKVTKLKANVNAAGVTSGPAYDQFINKMNIKIVYDGTVDRTLYDGPLSGLLNGWVDIAQPMNSSVGSTLNVSFEAHLDNTADNAIQGQNFVFDFSFFAEQRRNNP